MEGSSQTNVTCDHLTEDIDDSLLKLCRIANKIKKGEIMKKEKNAKIKVIRLMYVDNYDVLVKAEGQRNQGDNKELIDSIHEFGMCSAITVVQEEDKYIVVDGWHRKKACEKAKLPIPCIVVETQASIQDLMIALNTTMWNWKPKDFLNFGITFCNNPDYVFLDKIYQESELSLVALYEIFSFDMKSHERKKSFERGTWEITTHNVGMKTIEYANILKQALPREFKFANNANFLRGFAICVKKKAFDFDHLLAKVSKYKSMVHDGDKPSQHAQMINEIYNLNTHEDKQAYLA